MTGIAAIPQKLWMILGKCGQYDGMSNLRLEQILSAMLLALVFGMAAVSLVSRLYLMMR